MSPDSFIAMGGYAAYVWGSFGAFAVVLIWNIVTPLLQRRSTLKLLAEEVDDTGNRE